RDGGRGAGRVRGAPEGGRAGGGGAGPVGAVHVLRGTGRRGHRHRGRRLGQQRGGQPHRRAPGRLHPGRGRRLVGAGGQCVAHSHHGRVGGRGGRRRRERIGGVRPHSQRDRGVHGRRLVGQLGQPGHGSGR